MLKVVIDANIWTSALINAGMPYKVVRAFRNNLFQVFYPPQLLIELSDVLYRDKLRTRIDIKEIPELLELIETKATVVAINQLLSVSRDPNDNAYLSCAQVASCDFLVTGDRKGLLYLIEFGVTKIVTATDFLQVLDLKD